VLFEKIERENLKEGFFPFLIPRRFLHEVERQRLEDLDGRWGFTPLLALESWQRRHGVPKLRASIVTGMSHCRRRCPRTKNFPFCIGKGLQEFRSWKPLLLDCHTKITDDSHAEGGKKAATGG